MSAGRPTSLEKPAHSKERARAGNPWGSPTFVGSRREDRHCRAVLVVVLGRRGGACRASGGRSRGAGPRGAACHGERSSRPVHPGPPPARRASRRSARERHPGRTVGDRPRKRLVAEHRAEPPCVLPGPPSARARAVRRPPSARADDARDLRRRPRRGQDAHRGDAPRIRRPRLDAARNDRLGLPDGPRRPAHRSVRAGPRVGRGSGSAATGRSCRTAS